MDSKTGLLFFTEQVLGRPLLDSERSILEKQFNDLQEKLKDEPIETPEQTTYSIGAHFNRVVEDSVVSQFIVENKHTVALGHQLGKSTALKNVIEALEQLELKSQLRKNSLSVCKCVKCRMGRPDQCTTYKSGMR